MAHPTGIQPLQRFKNGIEGIFRKSILKKIPADRVDQSYDPITGCSNKDLHAVIGLRLLAASGGMKVPDSSRFESGESMGRILFKNGSFQLFFLLFLAPYRYIAQPLGIPASHFQPARNTDF